MISQLRDAWAYSLRFGKNIQIASILRDEANGRCCLGDLGDVCGLQWVKKTNVSIPTGWGYGFVEYLERAHDGDKNTGTLTELALDMTGLSHGAQMCFTEYNDAHQLTFAQIADIIDYGFAPSLPDRDDYDFKTGECLAPASNINGPGENELDDHGIRWYTI